MNLKKIIKYLCITFSITYLFWGLRAYLSTMKIYPASSFICNLLFVLGSFAPTIGALFCLEGKSIKEFIKDFFHHKKGSVWYIIFFSIGYFLAFYLSSLKLVEGQNIFTLIVYFLAMIIFGGCNEEIGWSGFLSRELEKKMNKFAATLVRNFIWTLWHLPLFFTVGDVHYGLPIYIFFLSLLTMSIIITALLKRTESIFYCGILHAICNVGSTCVAYEQNIIMYAINISLWIIAIILWYYPKEKSEIIENN